jgi:uncharacterized protein (TIGR00725 family)
MGRIGILGSARLGPEDPRFGRAIDLGGALARAGHVVVTGGYGGLMAAVSRGTSEAGGHVVGLPVRDWTNLQPNEWVAESIVADDFFSRLRTLSECDILVALAGGIGTLAEASVTWANLQTDAATTPPLIFVGSDWPPVVDALRDHLVIDARDLGLIRFVETEDAVPALVAELLATARADGRLRFG